MHAKRTWVWCRRSAAVDTHAGGCGCLDTEGAVFDHHAPCGRGDHGAGGLQEQVRCAFRLSGTHSRTRIVYVPELQELRKCIVNRVSPAVWALAFGAG